MVKGDQSSMDMSFWAALFKAGLRQHRVSAKFEFRFESLKGISVLVLFVYKLMIGSSKNSTENYPRKCFWTQEKETQVKFNPGLSASAFEQLGPGGSRHEKVFTNHYMNFESHN